MNEFLTTSQLPQRIGRTEAALRNLANRRKIPHRRVGGRRLMFVWEEIEKWIKDSPGLRLEDLQE